MVWGPSVVSPPSHGVPAWCPLSPLSHGVPAVSPVPTELRDAAKRFSQGGVSHYLTLTLDEAEGLLYVGAREAVFALATGSVELKAAVRPRGTPKLGGGLGWGVTSLP